MTAENTDQGGEEYERICKVRQETNASRRSEINNDNGAGSGSGGYSKDVQEKQLRQLLTHADEIQSMEHFTYWKDEFLASFREYINPQGATKARQADDALYDKMEILGKKCLTVKELCNDNHITADRISVKGQNALNEWVAEMVKIETLIRDFMPKTDKDDITVGYTKFELAAVLIRDGFRVYGIMVMTRDYILSLRDGPLSEGDILKANSKSIMNFYLQSIDSFCDTMADLGLHRLMEKCVELYSIRPRKKKKKKSLANPKPQPPHDSEPAEIPHEEPEKDALSDTSEEGEGPTKGGRMFNRAKKNFKAVMDHGWTSGTTREQRKAPRGSKRLLSNERWGEDGNDSNHSGPGAGTDPGSHRKSGPHGSSDDDDETREEKETDYIYYLDPVTEKVGKIPRNVCLSETSMMSGDAETDEGNEGLVQKWDGPEGQNMIIWKFKEILKGHSLQKK